MIDAEVDPPGFQLYEVAPVAVRVTVPLPQITPLIGLEDALTTGSTFTVNVAAVEVTTPQVPVTMQ